MSSLSAIAGSILPELIGPLARDGGGALKRDVEALVAAKAGAGDADGALRNIIASPQVEAALRDGLAELAARDSAGSRRDAATPDAPNDLPPFAEADDHTPAILSYIVVGGFLAVALLFMTGQKFASVPSGAAAGQIANLLIGVLAAAFATVINFWLGSSLGSHRKDAAAAASRRLEQMANSRSEAPAPPAPTPQIAATGAPAAAIRGALASQRKWRIPASVSLAQFGLESGWGAHMPAGSNNPFGVKAVNDQPAVAAMTTETLRGRSVRMVQKFRRFASLEEAFDAHGKLLATSAHYARARAALPDADAFAHALTGVYATDPHYGEKLVRLMKLKNLYRFDEPPGVAPQTIS